MRGRWRVLWIRSLTCVSGGPKVGSCGAFSDMITGEFGDPFDESDMHNG